MSNLRIAAEQALKSLGDAITVWTEEMEFRSSIDAADEWLESYAALREALADQSEQALEIVKPVAWMVYTIDGKSAFVTDNPKDFTQDHRALPLYTHPPQHNPLTDAEIARVMQPFESVEPEHPFWVDVARAIERAHGIGGKE